MAKPPAKVDLEASDLETESLAETLTPLFRPERAEEGLHLVSMIVSKYHEGPLPPPELLHGYDQVLAGAAERIVAMAEREQDHRHVQESRMVRGEYWTRWTGQFGAIVAIGILAALAAFCVWEKQPLAAGVITAIGVLPMAFLKYSQHSGNKEQEAKKAPPKRPRNNKRR